MELAGVVAVTARSGPAALGPRDLVPATRAPLDADAVAPPPSTGEALVTGGQARGALSAVEERFSAHLARGGAGPELTVEWDWSGRAVPTIWWEDGPERWAVTAVAGGADDDGAPLAPVQQPAGVVGEPFGVQALLLHPAEA